MNTLCDSIPWAVMRQPSMSRCGVKRITSRSLKAPGSDSSALITRYVGLPVPLARSEALRPVGKPAPPRPRRFAVVIASTIACGSIARACASAAYPPTSRYSPSRVRSWSSVPAVRSVCLLVATKVLDETGDVLGSHRLVVAVVDHDHGRPTAAARALDRAKRDLAILGRLARAHAQLRRERLEHGLRAGERARQIRADLDEVPADGLEVVHVVEGGDRLAVGGRLVHGVRDLAQRLGREPAPVLLLREPERVHDRRALVRVAPLELLHSVVESRAHRSASPMTGSSEAATAMRSATSPPRTTVAVACSAAKLGARNFTRQGRSTTLRSSATHGSPSVSSILSRHWRTMRIDSRISSM